MVAVVGRHKAVLVAVEYCRLEPVEVGNRLLAVCQLAGADVMKVDVEAELSHHRHVDTELDARILVPRRHVGTLNLGREHLRIAPLYEQPLNGVGVVAGPHLGEILQRFVVGAAASARAQHHGQVGILGLYALEHIVKPAHVVYIQVGLVVPLVVGVDVGYGAVAVPLEVGYARIAGEQPVDHAKHVVLHLRVAHVEHQLVAEVILLTVGQGYHPVLVLLIQLRLRVHHLWLYPQPELHPLAPCLVGEAANAVGQLAGRDIPVAQALRVAMARIFVAKPTVVEQEHVDTQLLGVGYERQELVFVEVEIGGLPVVEQRHAVARAVFHPVLAGPVVQVAAGLARAALAQREDEVGSTEAAALVDAVLRGIGVDATEHTQRPEVVDLEREAVVACPCQCAHEHLAGFLGGRRAYRELEERRRKHVGTGAELGVYHLLAEVQLLRVAAHLGRPVAVVLRQVILRGVEVEHGRGVLLELNGLFLAVEHLAPCHKHVFVGVCHEVQRHLVGIHRVGKPYHGLRSPGARLCLVRPVLKQRRRVGVGPVDVDGRLEIVFHAMGLVGFLAQRQAGIV